MFCISKLFSVGNPSGPLKVSPSRLWHCTATSFYFYAVWWSTSSRIRQLLALVSSLSPAMCSCRYTALLHIPSLCNILWWSYVLNSNANVNIYANVNVNATLNVDYHKNIANFTHPQCMICYIKMENAAWWRQSLRTDCFLLFNSSVTGHVRMQRPSLELQVSGIGTSAAVAPDAACSKLTTSKKYWVLRTESGELQYISPSS